MSQLHGKRIVVTREQKQAKEFSKKIKAAGGIPIEVPLLQITSKDAANKTAILEKLSTYRWIIFTSANGVHAFLQQLSNEKRQSLQKMHIAVVGHKTEAALATYHLSADLVPEVYDAERLAETFLQKYQAGESILLVRGSRSRDVLPNVFSAKEIAFDTIEVYETIINHQSTSLLQHILKEKKFDFITFTSPSTIEAFVKLGGRLPHVPCVCIGTTTAETAKQFGFTSILTAETFTVEGMIEVISKHIM